MTLSTILAFLAFVDVILFVTSEAVLGEVLLVKDTLVAGGAFNRSVFSP